MSNYITELKINKVRHLENLSIYLGDTKKHLILTGKNGSGKSSVLEELNNSLLGKGEVFIKTDTNFVTSKKGETIYAFFSAKRTTNSMDKPNGIEKIELSKIKDEKLNKYFLKYIVALKAERSFAKDDNDTQTVKTIDSWFNTFEKMLRQIFNDPSLELQFDRRNIMSYNFLIKRSNRELFDFTTLSDGYSAIIDIVTELLLKIETTESKSFDIEGIVLIDEVETHLHVEMQKNIMPLLTNFFPNIQFIVTTHSPFVLQSIDNSVVYDLEKQIQVEDLSGYSYDALVESYFDSDKYSQEVKDKIEVFETLSSKSALDDNEKEEYYRLKKYFDSLPTFMSDELAVKLNEIKLRNLSKAV